MSPLLPTAGALHTTLSRGIEAGLLQRNRYGINPLMHNLETALQMCVEVGSDRSIISAILLHQLCQSDYISLDAIKAHWGDDTSALVEGLIKISGLYSKQAAVMSENFRNLLLTFARDIRVIIIMIVERQVLMRAINHHPNENYVREVAARPTTSMHPSPIASVYIKLRASSRISRSSI